MQIFIVERKRGVSSWIKLGPASLGPLLEGLVFCTKDMRTEHWEKLWQENGRTFSLVRGENKGGCFLRLGVVNQEKKRFSIFVPKGRGAKGGWALLLEALQGVEVASKSNGEAVVRVKVDNRVLSQNLKKLAHCLGNLGLAKLESGKALLEFEVMAEAEKALKGGEVSVGGFLMRLEKWSQMTGCV
ncbi:hypothetical protein CK203_026740 [Vitis vinifera]|uniref:DUF4283 domain-containing protein n=1 Tax=Vitis vinifera TaxID=29760 RepID=A0A438ITQ6_VITVI|nr:hypothetical protein CK203_026740 [Vitis vinifera]